MAPPEISNPVEIARAVASRHRELVQRLGSLGDADLAEPSNLPGWSRLTVVCHLRYGAIASRSMTVDALSGKETSFYPDGRDLQRPMTLQPGVGEEAGDVVRSLVAECRQLDDLWSALDDVQWRKLCTEPPGNADLGTVTLAMLALLRLTEVEVHGADLAIGLAPWSDVFVAAALPMRLRWLATRQTNARQIDDVVTGRWSLRSLDGPQFVVERSHDGVVVHEGSAKFDTELRGSAHDLLGFLLGRLPIGSLDVTGDQHLARTFHLAFPPP